MARRRRRSSTAPEVIKAYKQKRGPFKNCYLWKKVNAEGYKVYGITCPRHTGLHETPRSMSYTSAKAAEKDHRKYAR